MKKETSKIKKLRKQSGLGYIRFAAKCGVSASTIQNYEKTGVKSVSVAQKIADACGVDISEVL